MCGISAMVYVWSTQSMSPITALIHPCIVSQPTAPKATEFYPALYTDFDYS